MDTEYNAFDLTGTPSDTYDSTVYFAAKDVVRYWRADDGLLDATAWRGLLAACCGTDPVRIGRAIAGLRFRWNKADAADDKQVKGLVMARLNDLEDMDGGVISHAFFRTATADAFFAGSGE